MWRFGVNVDVRCLTVSKQIWLTDFWLNEQLTPSLNQLPFIMKNTSFKEANTVEVRYTHTHTLSMQGNVAAIQLLQLLCVWQTENCQIIQPSSLRTKCDWQQCDHKTFLNTTGHHICPLRCQLYVCCKRLHCLYSCVPMCCSPLTSYLFLSNFQQALFFLSVNVFIYGHEPLQQA